MGNNSNYINEVRSISTSDGIVGRVLPQIDKKPKDLPRTYFPETKPVKKKYNNLSYRAIAFAGIVIIGYIIYNLIVNY